MIRGIIKIVIDRQARREWRFLALLRVGRMLMPAYRFHWPKMAWGLDDDFNAYLAKFDLLGSCNTDRRWMLHQLTQLAKNIPGDTAECGVMGGASSYLICKRLRRRHFLFDSFEGLSEPGDSDGAYFH